jgi:hypothetical protein
MRLDPFVAVNAREDAVDAALDAFGELGLRRRTEQSRAPVETIDFHKNRAGFRGAAPAQHRKRAVTGDAADQGGDENIGA